MFIHKIHKDEIYSDNFKWKLRSLFIYVMNILVWFIHKKNGVIERTPFLNECGEYTLTHTHTHTMYCLDVKFNRKQTIEVY